MYKRTNDFNNKIVAPVLREVELDLLLRLKDPRTDESQMFKDHMKKVYKKLQKKREKFFEVYQDFNPSSRHSYLKYWDDKYESKGKMGILLLNLGTVFLLLALLVLMYANWGNQFHSPAGAIIAVTVISLGIVVFCILNWGHILVRRFSQSIWGWV